MSDQNAPPADGGLLERKTRELEALVDIGKALTSTLDLREVLQLIMDKVNHLLRPSSWSLLLLDDQTGELYFEIVVSPLSEKLKNLRLARGEGIAGWVALHNAPLLIKEPGRDPRFAPWVDREMGLETSSVLCVPLKCKNRVTGVIELINGKAGGSFEESDLRLMEAVADFAAIAIDNARSFALIQQLVITDELTGLYNAGYFLDFLDYELERARRYQASLSVVFLDMDYFKKVNDSYGHLVGSRLLTEVGQLLKRNVRKADIAARYGGDEFVIVLPNTPKEGAFILAEKLRDLIRENDFLVSQGHRIRVTASFGLASYPDDGDSKLKVIQLADEAMYAAKDAGRDMVRSA
jgi:diguanylate cyclase (GGDEF)-like protein